MQILTLVCKILSIRTLKKVTDVILHVFLVLGLTILNVHSPSISMKI